MENNKRLKKSRYMPGLDGLRAIAVLGVIFYHLTPHILPGGFLGVPIFFVLSGYLITDLLIQEFQQNKKISLKQFWKRRLNRLYPALLAMLILVTGWITLFQRELLLNIRGAIISSLLYLNNWWQIIQGESYFDRFATPSPFVHLWSLALEGQFYLVWPVIVVLATITIKKNSHIFYLFMGLSIISALLMAILFVPNGDPSRVYYGTDTRAFSLLIGSAISFVWPSTKLKEDVPLKAKLILESVGLVALAVLIFMMTTVMATNSFAYYGGMFLFSLVSGVLIGIVAHPATYLSRFLGMQPFKWLGQRSYGLYLWQYPVMVLYEVKIGDTSIHPMRHLLIQLFLIVLMTEASYSLIEMPFKKLNVKAILNWQVIVEKWHSLLNGSGLRGWLEKGSVAFICFTLLISTVGFIMAPTGENKSSTQLAEKIATNKAKLEEQKSTATKPKETVPLVEGITPAEMETASQMNATFIGDSVMLSVVEPLQVIFPKGTIDGEVGRQLYNTAPVIERLKAERKLGSPVILELGTNGAFTDSQMDELLNTIDNNTPIYLVNTQVPKNWKNSVNAGLVSASKRFKNVHLIDWNQYSKDRTDWFYNDGVHPNEEGAKHYAQLIAKTVLTEEVKKAPTK